MKCPYCKSLLNYGPEDLKKSKGTVVCSTCAGIFAIYMGLTRFLNKIERDRLRKGKCDPNIKVFHDNVISKLIG